MYNQLPCVLYVDREQAEGWTDLAVIERWHQLFAGHPPGNLPPVLERLQIDPRNWLYMAENFESRFKGLVGAAYSLRAACETLGYRRTPNLSACRELLT